MASLLAKGTWDVGPDVQSWTTSHVALRLPPSEQCGEPSPTAGARHLSPHIESRGGVTIMLQAGQALGPGRQSKALST